jgi:chemotaxis family two-component system response regulator Rcp1
MTNPQNSRPIDILMVEDSIDDIEITIEALKSTKINNNLVSVRDGIEAMALLRREGEFADAVRPDLILLDLNMPRMDGRQVLEQIKSDADLQKIPVVVLTTSEAEEDVLKAYELHANCYITKPVGIEQFIKVVKSIEDFWFSVVRLPSEED